MEYLQSLLLRIKNLDWIDWGLICSLISLAFFIWYVFTYQNTLIIQVLAPSITIIVAILIMLKSARSTRVSTENHIQAIQNSTRQQIDSAMSGFKPVVEGLAGVIGQLDLISISMQKTATEANIIRQLEESKAKFAREAEERARIARMPKIFTTLELHGWIWKSYRLRIECEDNDAENVTIRFTSFNPNSQCIVIGSQSFIKLTRQEPISVICGPDTSIKGLTSTIEMQISLRDLGKQSYIGETRISLQDVGKRLSVQITPLL